MELGTAIRSANHQKVLEMPGRFISHLGVSPWIQSYSKMLMVYFQSVEIQSPAGFRVFTVFRGLLMKLLVENFPNVGFLEEQ